VEARGRDQGGENLVGGNATKGSASEPSAKPDLGGTDPQDAQILGAATNGTRSTRERAEPNGRETARGTGQVETSGPLPTGEIL
jgi:hypothetical protein